MRALQMETMTKNILAMLTLVLSAGALSAAAGPEVDALRVLQDSGATLAARSEACRALKQSGSAAAVPALAALLADTNLAQRAIDALETMPGEEAGNALRSALHSTGGSTRAGVIHAVGMRRDAAAVPDLVKSLSDADDLAAVQAAQALGRIGGDASAAALSKARAGAPPSLRAAIAHALLECADGFLVAGRSDAAQAIFTALYDPVESAAIRAAACRGVVLSSGNRSVEFVCKALSGGDAVAQVAVIPLIRELPGEEATRQFARVLDTTAPAARVSVIDALCQRGDPAAADALAHAMKSSEPEARMAILKAMGELGDASQVPLLLESAASGSDPERGAARQSLLALRRGDVGQALLSQWTDSRAEVRAEIIDALVRRGEIRAIPTLLTLAESADAAARSAALEALARLADDAHAGDLLGLILRADTEEQREAARRTYVSAGSRSPNPSAFSAAALGALAGAASATKPVLLSAAGQLGGPGSLEALRQGARGADPVLRDAAIRAMAGHAGVEALPDLLALASEAATDTHRALALRGYWRLVERSADRPAAERLQLCRDGLAASSRPEDKRLGLVELGKLALPEALELAEAAREDAAVRAEAQVAVAQIESRLRGSHWLVAGPYRQEGVECQQLFDVRFPPEQGEPTTWRVAQGTNAPQGESYVELADVVAGNHCVAYLKSRIFSPDDRAVQLAIASDDGIKLWINGELVHANNAVRGISDARDRATARLRQGWNDVLAKITQHTMGCCFLLRIADENGAPIEGLQIDAGGDGERADATHPRPLQGGEPERRSPLGRG
jgi:HEAT repeat protein